MGTIRSFGFPPLLRFSLRLFSLEEVSALIVHLSSKRMEAHRDHLPGRRVGRTGPGQCKYGRTRFRRCWCTADRWSKWDQPGNSW